MLHPYNFFLSSISLASFGSSLPTVGTERRIFGVMMAGVGERIEI
jgi:hypothetical protein